MDIQHGGRGYKKKEGNGNLVQINYNYLVTYKIRKKKSYEGYLR